MITTLLATHISDNLYVLITIVTTTSFFLAIIFANIFTKEILNIKTYLAQISNKNYNSSTLEYQVYEFGFLAKYLQKFAKRLQNQKNQRLHVTASLKLANRQKDDIISAIGHEFKNPLAAVMGYAQTISEDKDMPPAIRNRFLDKIYANSIRVTEMLDRLNLAVKFEKSKLIPKMTTFDLKDTVNNVKETLEGKYKGRLIHIDATSSVVKADKTLIELAIVNLCDNALKYSENDIFLSIKNTKVSVRDTGQGIEKKEIHKIQEKFYRVKDNTWDNSLGLGLSIIKYILKLHHSTLHIESQINQGSTFSFHIK